MDIELFLVGSTGVTAFYIYIYIYRKTIPFVILIFLLLKKEAKFVVTKRRIKTLTSYRFFDNSLRKTLNAILSNIFHRKCNISTYLDVNYHVS